MRHIVLHAGALVVGLAWLYKATEIAADLFRHSDRQPTAWAVDMPILLIAFGPLAG
jgi:hypothetical protein